MPHNIDVIDSPPATDLLNSFKAYSGLTSQQQDSKSLIKLILENFPSLIGKYVSISDYFFEKINGQSNHQIFESYLLHYQLPRPLKNVALLHRDVLLQLTIARCKEYDNQLSTNAVEKHFLESRHTLFEALTAFSQDAMKEMERLSTSQLKPPKFIKQIKHQQNPWQLYRKQFQQILDQLSEIDQSGKEVIKLVDAFQSLKEYVGSLTQQIEAQTQSWYSQLESTCG